MEQAGGEPVPQIGQPLHIGSALPFTHWRTALLLHIVDQQAVCEVRGQEEGRVGGVEEPVRSDQAGQGRGVDVSEQLQAVGIETVQTWQLQESLEWEQNEFVNVFTFDLIMKLGV